MNWKNTSAEWKRNTFERSKPSRAAEICYTDDAEILLVGYGIVSRVLLSTVEALAHGRRESRLVPAHHFVALSFEGAAGSGGESARKFWWSS